MVTRCARTLALASCCLLFGLAAIALGQDAAAPAPTVESRVLLLEESVARLSTLLQMRTEASGPQDRLTRDFNLETRLGNLERQVQQLSFQVSNLNNQISSAISAANQAQRDAQMAQQMARDAAFR